MWGDGSMHGNSNMHMMCMDDQKTRTMAFIFRATLPLPELRRPA